MRHKLRGTGNFRTDRRTLPGGTYRPFTDWQAFECNKRSGVANVPGAGRTKINATAYWFGMNV
jgi:hypothetical protein